MNATQLRLLPDSRPLVELLGAGFFRSIPESPGVYLLRDASDAVLYVGKARNLRQRLRSYRVANPDSQPRRRVRLLHLARRIEWQITGDEPAALARERELLRELKPRFNRAGVWPSPPRYVAWRVEGVALELRVSAATNEGWNHHGPLGAVARGFRVSVVRLLWCGWFGRQGATGLPAGWIHGRLPECVSLRPDPDAPVSAQEAAGLLNLLCAGNSGPLRHWLHHSTECSGQPFLRSLIAADLDSIAPQEPDSGTAESAAGPLTAGGSWL
ncbi:MAG: hypothetical protein RIS76_3531 [Verrucomicrobiota bacterium]